ncbi:MAG: methionine--tRNA ligase subunit beta [Candidatus Lokiarchaeota archaeon]|nr:methionine--tRNA ligase subunit beta [Candidatus Lokiarchaeota archaeon]
MHRTLTFIEKQFEMKIPGKIKNDEIDEAFIEKLNNINTKIGSLLINFKLKKALRELVDFGRDGNVYLNDKAPWHLIKEDKDAAGHVFNLCAQAAYALAILLAPFIPGTAKKILSFLNVKKTLKELTWDSINEEALPEGQKIRKPKPLFQKLDTNELQEKLKELKAQKEKGEKRKMISYDQFKELDIRIALVEKVEKVPKADKLFKLSIDVGSEKRTLAASLAEYYKPEELVGKKIVFLANLEPKKLRGILSQGMLLAAVEGDAVSVLTPDKDVAPGAKIE